MPDPDPYDVGQAVLDRLCRHNDDRRAQGLARREEIRQVLDTDPESSAREIRDKLRDTPSLRTVQRHLKIIRDTRRRGAID